MKYMSYYEENGRITKNDYRRIEKTLQEEAPDKFERMLLRKMEFVNVEGYISRDEELPRYYLCRKTKENHEEFLYLEKKNVQNGVVYKYCCTLTREECQAVMDGNIVWMQEHEHPLVRDLYRQMTINGLPLCFWLDATINTKRTFSRNKLTKYRSNMTKISSKIVHMGPIK